MKRSCFLIIMALVFFPFTSANSAVMSDYCQVPPYVSQNIPPNVMIVLDNSGSMLRFAYYDGYTTPTDTTDDNDCRDSAFPCTRFAESSTYPNFKHYGYFNPDYWYAYANNRFYPVAPKSGSGISGARAKNATEWDGNFLNWLTMRRIDIVRKVLTGGKAASGEGSGFERLLGEIADDPSRGTYKRVPNVENYVNSTLFSGTRCFSFATGSSGTSSFSVSAGSGCGSFSSNFNVAVRVPAPVSGVLQEVVGTRARIGLSFYNVNNPTPQGGRVRVDISGGSLSSTVNEINLTRPDSNTPLAETLWTMAGYFAQVGTIAGGPGPRYSSADYQINNNVDPFNYSSGGQPRWPRCSKNFVLYITDGEPCADGNLPATIKNYASGKSAYNCYDLSPGSPGRDGYCPSVGSFPASTLPSCYGGNEGGYVAGIEDVALWVHTTDLRSQTLGVNDIPGMQNLTLYTVFAFGQGSTLLRYTSINGGFDDLNANGIPDLQMEWDQNGDGNPDNFYEATEGRKLEASIKAALDTILKRAASGTAASVLASGEGSGANLIQAVFYPRRRFGNDIISWSGSAQNLWYYLDPFLLKSSLREETQGNTVLDLSGDYIARLYFDPVLQRTLADLYEDSNGDGVPDTPLTPTLTIFIEDIKSLWEAGKILWDRDISADPRTIFTTINGTTFLPGNFHVSNAAALSGYLQATDVDGNGTATDEAEYIIRYTHGEGLTTEDLDGNGTNDTVGVDLDNNGFDDFRSRYARIVTEKKVWKLGDILGSTPRTSSWIQLNTYDSRYNDATYKNFIKDKNDDGTPRATPVYTNRGMVFIGGNDGMLHAFKLGQLELEWTGQGTNQKARITGANIGREMWAFIPRNSLPYLKYIMDPDYCHIYTVDLTPYIFDASINKPAACTEANEWDCVRNVESWRTILIGGMKTGGACRGTSIACNDVSGDGAKDCVNTPVTVGGQNIGLSSYFALDVTDQNNPRLLWEFTHEELGFATAGPAIVRTGDRDRTGRWFAVLGSGPTGPIDPASNQFLARSDQSMKLFVLDLRTGTLERKIDTGIPFAFAGSMINATNDSDLDYRDDTVYIGYAKRRGAGTNASPYTWTEGGIGRLMTKENNDPAQWVWSRVIDNIGSVTTSVAALQNKNKGIQWLYFGTGRWYYVVNGISDDPGSQRRIFGIKEPCYAFTGLDPDCTASYGSAGDFTNVSDVSNVPDQTFVDSATFKGWYIDLESSGNYVYDGSSQAFHAERVITDPLTTSSGLVFFSTYKPFNDECGVGGKTFLWSAKYDSGGPGGTLLKGKALIQVSTGSIEEISLSSGFTEKGGRRTSAIEGVPPTAQGLTILSPPPPVKRIIHMRER